MIDENEVAVILENYKRILRIQSDAMDCCSSSSSLHLGDPELNKSSNRGWDDEAELSYYPDAFTKVLDEEGLLKYSNPISRMPVLSLCYGFLNSELLTLSLTYMDERKYRESYQNMDDDKRETYCSLFSSQFSMQPLVDGLPESVWLECVEPTLAILKALNSLKRRKCNLSIRKSTMNTVDSTAGCHGDYEAVPLMFNPFLHGHHLRLLRVQFLALEGVLNAQYGNNQDEVQRMDGGPQVRVDLNNNIVMRRHRRLHHNRPYEVPQQVHLNNNNAMNNANIFGDLIRGANSLIRNMGEIREM
ncbi:uncharacterized protein LOC106076883 [Biomphalaria glabrata]|uniref:Uncharacterized protein LOC106076883 n=1 Tax=Biomphalaria glabrata TaxID=6526 RepID=A0A9W3AQI8_BIOGL|nr:uncharacterized protein LOC106076883 [Biomphalaria glabrata]